MSFKIPCGGFKLDEKSFSLDENGVLSVSGGGSIPKPLTYDYMPEGYPKKGIGPVTLMEEREVTFSSDGFGAFMAVSPVALDAKLGDKLTVVWDGVSYDVIAKELEENVGFGNLSILDPSKESTGEPFIYTNAGSIWFTTDAATTHTIKVMRQQMKYTPIDANYIPDGYPNEARVTEMINAALGVIENGSY